MASRSMAMLAAMAAMAGVGGRTKGWDVRPEQRRAPLPPHVRKGEKYPGQRTAYLIGTNNAHKRVVK